MVSLSVKSLARLFLFDFEQTLSVSGRRDDAMYHGILMEYSWYFSI
jgi:hypothetical protein